MGILNKLGIVKSSNSKAERIFENLLGNFFEVEYSNPNEYIAKYWNTYLQYPNQTNSLNGKIFEYIIATLCVREKILPFYLEAKVAFVPNVDYDLIFYTKERGPICWSIKTSLRERYKQADLEAIALKYVHRKAINYLITLDDAACNSVKTKIKEGDIIGIDNVILATSYEFNNIINELKEYDLFEPQKIDIILSKQIVNYDTVSSVLPGYDLL